MPALNFKKQFVKAVRLGLRCKPGGKRQTIRAIRKRPFVAGDELILFTGMRTKQCCCLGVALCKSAYPLRMDQRGNVFITGIHLSNLYLVALALADGFDSVASFRDFFRINHGLPFRGQLIRW